MQLSLICGYVHWARPQCTLNPGAALLWMSCACRIASPHSDLSAWLILEQLQPQGCGSGRKAVSFLAMSKMETKDYFVWSKSDCSKSSFLSLYCTNSTCSSYSSSKMPPRWGSRKGQKLLNLRAASSSHLIFPQLNMSLRLPIIFMWWWMKPGKAQYLHAR